MMRYERFSIKRGTHSIGNYVKSIDSIVSLNHESDEKLKKKHENERRCRSFQE